MSLPKLIEGVPSNLTEVFDVQETIGEGNFAKVKKAKHKKTGKQVAIKMIDKAKIIKDPHQLKSIISEIGIMKELKHANIVQLLDVYETADRLCLVMELVTGGELFDRIVDLGAFSETDAAALMHSMFDAIKYMHDKGIAHRDLKPENILCENEDPNSPVKVSDFGLSKVIDTKSMMQTCCGTPGYVAPEVLNYTGYGPEVDMWSLGVLMYVLLCGFPPFYDENDAVLFQIIQSGKYDFPSPYFDSISKEAKDLISHLLVVDPKKRYTAAQAIAHPWFKAKLPTHHLSGAQKKLKEQRD
ncbi:putative Calcium/calmodulin-dependent protein kinase type 1 [Blattamonas nauphoetae]|uniref:Calcium/calmodulin-dependent protein kinase type 1 n=1 Tax=Blattamonas nauphoetae TaxID=2049346 RepID=A0ABQ9X8Y6_9EUKA|nr:putative Calcium/calmodulin-dependent protein kinase type 1 [Blattamonas nauphoetae]